MLWIIVFLLLMIFLVLVRATGMLALAVLFIGLGVGWWIYAAQTGDPAAAGNLVLGILVLFFVVGIFVNMIAGPEEKTCPHCDETIKYRAKVCKHCGLEQPDQNSPIKLELSKAGFARAFRMPNTTNWKFKDYAGACLLTFGVAVFAFGTLFILVPR